MGFKVLAAAAATVALTIATPAAAAISLTFNVQVTSAVGDPRFTPFTFQETWTFEPVASSSGGPPPFPSPYTEVDRIVGTPSVTASPLTEAVFGFPKPPTYDEARFASRRGYDSGGNLIHASAGMSFSQIWTDYTGAVGRNLESRYARTLDLQSAGYYLPASVDEAGLIAFIKAEGPIQWEERYTDTWQYFDGVTPPDIVYERAYRGTATLVVGDSTAPEPSAWALMIAGFGLAGAGLRRRRGLQAA